MHRRIGNLLIAAGLCMGPEAFGASRVVQHFLESNQSPQADWIVSPMLGIMPFAAREIGAKLSHQMWNDGFIDVLNDSVSIEGSLFYGRWRKVDDASLYLAGNLRWDFHLLPEWTVFAGPGLSIRSNKFEDNDDDNFPRVSMQVGGFWNIQPNMALRADVDLEDMNPRVGVAFRM